MSSKRPRRSLNHRSSDELNEKRMMTRTQCKTTKPSPKTSYDNHRKSSPSKSAKANVSSISDPAEAVKNVDKSEVVNSCQADLSCSTADTSNASAMLACRLGEIANVDESTNYFEHLPPMITESIISELSFRELMRSRSVCKSWNEIIGNPNFLKWKKTYYEMKLKHNTMNEFLHAAFPSRNEQESCQNIFVNLLRFMANDFPKKPPSGLGSLLCKMPICVTAEHFLLEKFPNEPSLSVHPWYVLTISILVSPTIKELYEMFECVIKNYNYNDILETMYCIASLFLHLAREFNISYNFHYRLYYVIYLLENKSLRVGFCPEPELPKKKRWKQKHLKHSSQPSVPEMTYEQLAILNHNLGPNQVVKIDGVAGAGKTSILAQFARKHSNLKFLYLANGELVCKNSASCFPPNVVCKTLRSLAYYAVGISYNHKLCDEIGVSDIQPFVYKKECFTNFMQVYRESILSTLKKFSQSADETLTVSHAVLCDLGLLDELHLCDGYNPATTTAKEFVCLTISDDAKNVWEKVISKDEGQCKISPGMYVKLFQLSRPVLSGYDCILVDEAEDFHSAALDIIFSQKVPVILAGDSNQQVDDFLQEQNPWSHIKATHTYRLTKSFRFGPEIAYVANCFTQNTKTTLVGTLEESYIDGTVKGQYAIVTGSSLNLFLEAVRLCCSGERRRYEPRTIRGAFLGGIENSGFNQIVDMYRLKSYVHRNDITDTFVKSFSDFSHLKTYVQTGRRNLGFVVDIVERLGAKILFYFNRIKNMCSCDLTTANVVFSLAQNMKGFEFDTVRLVNSLPFANIRINNLYYMEMHHSSPGSQSDGILNNKHNMVYISVTRAKKCLIMCEYTYSAIQRTQETFEYAVDSSLLLNNSVSLKCSRCSLMFEPSTVLTMVLKNMFLSSGRQIWGGPSCRACMIKKYRPGNIPPIYGSAEDYGPYRLACFMGVVPDIRSEPEIITIDED